MRILITGVTGFVGGHLAELLLGSGHELLGICRHARWPDDLSQLEGLVRLHSIDLTQQASVENLLQNARPDWIIHLAGYANTGKSFHDPQSAWVGNLGATQSLFDAIALSGTRPRILFVSTGLVYGNPGEGDQLCRETDALYPSSPYAASKAAADLLSYQVTRHPGLDVIRVRCFNQFGPRQSEDYATANFARQIAEIECGEQPPILKTGDLSGKRDLTDVRDMVRAFPMLLERGLSGQVYNAGSGTAHSMLSIMERLLALARVPIEVQQIFDPNRRADTSVSRADPSKLIAATGWRPEYSIDRSLGDLLEYWRRRTERGQRENFQTPKRMKSERTAG